MSDSFTFVARPTTRSSSSWAFFSLVGLLRRRDRAHVRVTMVVSLPANIRFCNNIKLASTIKRKEYNKLVCIENDKIMLYYFKCNG